MKSRFSKDRERHPWDETRRPSLWLAIPLAILLSGAALFGIRDTANSLAQGREAETLASNLGVLVETTHAAKTAQTGPTPGSELDAGLAIVQLEPAIVALEQRGASDETARIRATYDQLKRDVAEGEQAIMTGQRNVAQVNETVAASNQALAGAIGTARQALHQDVAAAQRLFLAITIATFVITGCALVGLIVLVGRQRSAAATMRQRLEAHFRAMTQYSGDVISLVDRNGTVRAQSSSLLRLLGRSDLWLIGRPFSDIVHADDKSQLREIVQTAITRNGEPAYGRLRLSHGDGTCRSVDVTAVYPADQAEIEGVLLTCRSMLEPADAQVVDTAPAVAMQHPVTGLLTEPLFRDRLDHALGRSFRTASPVALLVVELGGDQTFAGVSEDATGAALRAITGRMARSTRTSDSIAHLQGLEFAVILEDTDLETARTISRRIFEQLQVPVAHLNGQVRLAPRIGISIKTDPRDTVDTLLFDARTALNSKEPVGIEPPARPMALDLAATEEPAAPALPAPTVEIAPVPDPAPIVIEQAPVISSFVAEPQETPVAVAAEPAAPTVDRVLDPAAFELQFLPVLALETGEIVEIETFVRWRHPQRGLVPVEHSGMMDLVTPWMLEQACRLAPALPSTRAGHQVRISVNVSPLTPLDDVLVDNVATSLLTTGLEPSALQLEFAARALDAETGGTAVATLRQLRDLGVRLVLDGAGAEADRLPDFDRLPVHGVKIDRSVVTLLDRSADRRSLVRSVVERAKANGVAVTGVGVETLEQAERLWDLGADSGQGPLFFRPILEEQLAALFTTEPTLVAAD